VRIEASTVAGNSATNGGAILAMDGSSLALDGCTVSGNEAKNGGGLHVSQALGGPSADLRDCEVSANTAVERGGGVYGDQCDLLLKRTVISGNTAGKGGGGIAASDASLTVGECRIRGNSTQADGGGIRCEASVLDVEDSVLSRNTARHGAGDLLRRLQPEHPPWIIRNVSSPATRSETRDACTSATLRSRSTTRRWPATRAGTAGASTGVVYSHPTISSSILWDNAGGSFPEDGGSCPPSHSPASKGGRSSPGAGNINAPPGFCGYAGRSRRLRRFAATATGGGSPQSPFRSLDAALDFSLAWRPARPASDRGRAAPTWEPPRVVATRPTVATRTVHVAAGTYSVAGLNLAHHATIVGAGSGTTVIQGPSSGCARARASRACPSRRERMVASSYPPARTR